MGELFFYLEHVRAYIDDLVVKTKGSFQDHLIKLGQVFIRLAKAVLQVNASKSSFATEELEWISSAPEKGFDPSTEK